MLIWKLPGKRQSFYSCSKIQETFPQRKGVGRTNSQQERGRELPGLTNVCSCLWPLRPLSYREACFLSASKLCSPSSLPAILRWLVNTPLTFKSNHLNACLAWLSFTSRKHHYNMCLSSTRQFT